MTKPPFAKFASLKLSLILFLFVIIFNVLIFPFFAHAKNAEPIDIHFAYSPEKAYELINSYSEATRESYMISEMTLDVLYPVVYTLFMSISLILLFPSKEKVAWLPYLVFASDLIENTGIIVLLYNYPKELYNLAIITSVFSTIKWLLALLILMIMIIGLVRKFVLKSQKGQLD